MTESIRDRIKQAQAFAEIKNGIGAPVTFPSIPAGHLAEIGIDGSMWKLYGHIKAAEAYAGVK